MKSADGKRIRTTKAAVTVPAKALAKKAAPASVRGTSSFSSPRRTMSPVDYASSESNRFFNEGTSERIIIEGGAGRRTPVSGYLERGTSLDRTFASEKRNLPLKRIKESNESSASNSCELLSPGAVTKAVRSNDKTRQFPPGTTIKTSVLPYSSVKSCTNLTDDKLLNVSVAISPKGKEILGGEKSIILDKVKSPSSLDISTSEKRSSITKNKPAGYNTLRAKKSYSESGKITRRSLEDISNKSKSSAKSIKTLDKNKNITTERSVKFNKSESEKKLAKKNKTKSDTEIDKKDSKNFRVMPYKREQPVDELALRYIKSVDRNIDSYVAQYENDQSVNFNEIYDGRDAVLTDSFFQHLFLRDVPAQRRSYYNQNFYPTTVLERAKVFQNGKRGNGRVSRYSNSYLAQKRPVSESKFRSQDRYPLLRSVPPRSVSWPGKVTPVVHRFSSLSGSAPSGSKIGRSILFPKNESRSGSEPPNSKVILSQTVRPRSPVVTKTSKTIESPNKIVFRRIQSPPAKIVFSQTSRPLSPIVVHNKRKKSPEPIRKPSPSKIVLSQTSRPISTSNQIRSRSESPSYQYGDDINYYSDSDMLRRRAVYHSGSTSYTNKIRQQSPSPSPVRSPSCRRIHSARNSQCKAAECITGLKSKILRTRSAGDADTRERISPPRYDRYGSYYDLDHIRSHLDYQEYVTEMKNRKAKSDRFKELNRFYVYLERIGQLERATSTGDLRPRRKDEEIIDFDRWKKVRAKERAEEELDRLYKKMKTEQQEKDLLFLPHDFETLRWSQNKDWNLRVKEKSVEDLRDHFSKIADAESMHSSMRKNDFDSPRDMYKPLWRGSSVVNLASTMTKRHHPVSVNSLDRSSTKFKNDQAIFHAKDRLGIGNRLWSSLSSEQVSALKSQLNSIYSKELEPKPKVNDNINEKYIITVPSTSKQYDGSPLQVRCNSFSAGEQTMEMDSDKIFKADSIGSIRHVPLDEDFKKSSETFQNLSEKDKKRISMNLSREILERVKQNRDKYSPVVLAKETRGATVTARIRGISESRGDSGVASPINISNRGSEKKDITPTRSPEKVPAKRSEIQNIMDDWMEAKPTESRKTCLSPIRPSSASETEGSSDASNKTVIYRGSKDDIQKKVEFFENSQREDSLGTIIYHARDDSLEEKDINDPEVYETESRIPSPPTQMIEHRPSKSEHSQSYTDLKEIFGETKKNNYHSLSPVAVPVSSSKSDTGDLSLISNVSSNENICRSRSLSPDPEKYWRAYLSLVKSGGVKRLKEKFEFPEYFYDLEGRPSNLRRYRSDPEIIRTILRHNLMKRNLIDVKRHERGDVDRLTHKYEISGRGRARDRRLGMTSPVLKTPLRAVDREMPRIDVISKLAALKPRSSTVPSRTSPCPNEYPTECPIGEVERIRQTFERRNTSILGQMFTSTPDINELRDIAPYLSGPWTSHKYPSRRDNDRSLSSPARESEGSPVRRVESKSLSPSRGKTPELGSILKHRSKKSNETYAQQEFDPAKHRPRFRYLPEREPVPPARPARPAWPVSLPLHTAKPTVTFKESPRRYVESDVTIHYKCPVRQEPRPLVPEEELARRQADHMRRVYQEERRRKYLQELQDMNSRRHTDNFTPSQKSPISLNRYDSFGTRQVARALFNFVGQSTRELTFRKGDLILVRRQIDNNWFEGEHNSKVGLFPSNYVELIEYDSTSTPSQRRPSEGRARAKFNFAAQTHLELALRRGELVTLTRRVDDNWYEGRLGDRKGIFPVTYVEVLAEPTASRSTELSTPIVNSKPVASPAAHSVVGAAGVASLGSHHYTPQLNSPALSNSPSSTAPLTLPSHGITSHHARPASATLPRASDQTPVNLNNHEPLYVDTNAEAVPYRAMYKYRPQNPDELELAEGDTVYVLEKCDDGWYVGSSQRSGRFGTFPGNYVERI